jgi:hypothetical protein
MWQDVIVLPDEFYGFISNLIEIFEQISSKDIIPEGSVESFNEGILIWLRRLNRFQFDALVLAPFCYARNSGPLSIRIVLGWPLHSNI